MAALLCTAPCQLCKSVCECMGETCSCVTKPICTAISSCCKALSKACTSPFCLFVTTATGLNMPPIIMSFMAAPLIAENGFSCRGAMWLLVMLVMSVCNIAAAWYLAAKVTHGKDPEDGRTAAGRAMHLLCYDPIIALYILIAIGYVAWLLLGGLWTANGGMFEDSTCPRDLHVTTGVALASGCAFVLAGSIAFCCSMCCARDKR